MDGSRQVNKTSEMGISIIFVFLLFFTRSFTNRKKSWRLIKGYKLKAYGGDWCKKSRYNILLYNGRKEKELFKRPKYQKK